MDCEKMRIVSEVGGRVGHEVRNGVRVVGGFVEVVFNDARVEKKWSGD